MEKNKVYIVVEDWRIDSGESDIYTSVFSTIEKAEKYFEKLKERYAEDYDTNNRDDKYVYENSGEIEVTFEDNYDYYKIVIDEKIIDEEE